MQIGKGYIGSPDIMTSKKNEEIIHLASKKKIGEVALYKLSFLNHDPTRVRINKGEPIYLQAGRGFESTEIDAQIGTFEVVDEGVRYEWMGCY